MFDLTFFRFLLGFLAILSISFAALFFVGRHMENQRNIADAKKGISVPKSAQAKAPCVQGRTC